MTFVFTTADKRALVDIAVEYNPRTSRAVFKALFETFRARPEDFYDPLDSAHGDTEWFFYLREQGYNSPYED